MDPAMLIYDEPFVGLDPISMGVIAKLIRQMNDALGITSIVVSHDVKEIGEVADYSYVIADGKVAASGRPADLKNESSELVKQFMLGLADGPVAFHYDAPDYAEQLLGSGIRTRFVCFAKSGTRFLHFLHNFGGMCLFFLRLCNIRRQVLFKRFSLVVYQVYNAGALSLVVIMISGLFVGAVLACWPIPVLSNLTLRIRLAFSPVSASLKV